MEFKVKDLKKALKGLDDESIVIISKDSEGNYYSPLFTISIGTYSSESGDVGIAELTDEYREIGYTKKDVIKGESCIILYPL